MIKLVHLSAACLISLLVGLLMSASAIGAPADPDTSFGTGGQVAIPIDDLYATNDRGGLGVLQPDGRLLVAATSLQPNPGFMPLVRRGWLIARYTPEGLPDESFGTGGRTVEYFGAASGAPGEATEVVQAPSGGIALLPDGRFIVAGEAIFVGCLDCFYGNTLGIVARFNADGTLDSSFGSNGIFVGPNGFNSIAIDANGGVVLGANVAFVGFQLMRLDAGGSPDVNFAPTIACPFGASGTFKVAADGKIVVVTQYVFDSFGSTAFCISRLNSDGTPDATFGIQGAAVVEAGMNGTPGDFFFVDAAARITVGGVVTITVGGVPEMSGKLFRLTSDGGLDTGFGVGGFVADGDFDGMTAIAGDCAGRTLAAGPPTNGNGYFIMIRFWPDGSSDTTFTTTSTGLARTNVAAVPRQLLLRPDGRILALAVADNALTVVQYQGDPSCPATEVAAAVEYYYAAWNYYFVTAFQNEIAVLDGGAFGGVWQRTGETFNVWPQPNAAGLPTCRFFSTAFAPKSSHFYSPYANECALLMSNPDWRFEATAFYIALPDASGQCSAGTLPLYRFYNNGMGGAPNHRYTTSIATFNQMMAQGWTFEGNAATKVFACVPQ